MWAGERRFADRRHAGRALGAVLRELVSGDAIVLGLARGGVVVAGEVAAALGAPLDVLVVRKLGLPWQPELAMGAIAAVGDEVETVRVGAVLDRVALGEGAFEEVRQEELAELRRREREYRGERPPPQLSGRTVVLVDDGLATGATMRAAVAAVRRRQPAAVVVAVPVGSAATCARLADAVEDVVCLVTPTDFQAVGEAYADFAPTDDAEVRAALAAPR